jgi:hypothetical protein
VIKFGIKSLLSELEINGFVNLTGLINKNTIETINSKIERAMSQPHANGQRGFIKDGCQKYLADTISYGREIIDVYTNPTLIDLAESYAKDNIHLSNYRIYSTFPSKDFKMWWHLDNKIDTYDFENRVFVQKVIPDNKGLIFLMYLSDVEDGGVQLVRGSHKWSRDYQTEGFDHMEEEFSNEIVTFNNAPKGTFIAYDYALIHRAKPYTGGNVRTSMFGQLSPSSIPTGEPILLNSRDIVNLTEKQRQVLNFGKEPSTLNWPIGQIDAFNETTPPDHNLMNKIKALFV